MEPTPLQALAGRLIPASAEHGVPGADDALIFADIVGTMSPNRAELMELLAYVNDLGAAAIAERPLEELLGELAGEHGPAFGLFSVATIQAYYRDDRVMESLGLEARPPFPKGFVVEEGDFTLTDPVRARGPIWRAV